MPQPSDLEQVDRVLVVVPNVELGETGFEWFEPSKLQVLEWIERGQVDHVIIDFSRTTYLGSTALAWLVMLSKRLRAGEGHLLLCCLSTVEKEVLRMTRLDTLLSIVATRQDALDWLAPRSTPPQAA